MGMPDPILNFRLKQPIKDAFHLLSSRMGKDMGPLGRTWLIERMVQESALEVYRSVGLIELLRRLAQPSPSFSMEDATSDSEDGEVQTAENFVLHGKTKGFPLKRG